jgi:hypothetical protein
VYSFGVVLLELLSGRRSVDRRRRGREQHLVDWARPHLRHPERLLHRVMDPSLDGQYSARAAREAATVAYRCLHSVPKSRPTMRAAVDALEPLLAVCGDVPAGPFVYTVPPEPEPDGSDEAAATATAAVARKKCLASAAHAKGELRTTGQRHASSVAGQRSSSSPSPEQSTDRGA